MLRENHAVFLGKKYRFPREGGGINIRCRSKYRPLPLTGKILSLSFRNRYLKELCLVHRELVRCVTTVEFQAGIAQGLHQ
jgi:hypothetical protein